MFLPLVFYMVGSFATLTILSNNSLMENVGQDYVRTARSKGISENTVVYTHALRAAIRPLVTIRGLDMAALLSGPLITDQIFGIAGVGRLPVPSFFPHDLAVPIGPVGGHTPFELRQHLLEVGLAFDGAALVGGDHSR